MMLIPCPYCGPRDETNSSTAAMRPGAAPTILPACPMPAAGMPMSTMRANERGRMQSAGSTGAGCRPGCGVDARHAHSRDLAAVATARPAREPSVSLCRKAEPGSIGPPELRFSFDGRSYEGFAGDTLASALLANGVHMVAAASNTIARAGIHRPASRSRTRWCASARAADRAECARYHGRAPRWAGRARARTAGLRSRFDLGVAERLLGPLLPAGFYYKTFMWPPRVLDVLRAPDPPRRRPRRGAARARSRSATTSGTPSRRAGRAAAARPGSRRRWPPAVPGAA